MMDKYLFWPFCLCKEKYEFFVYRGSVNKKDERMFLLRWKRKAERDFRKCCVLLKLGCITVSGITLLYYREEKCPFLGVLASLAPTHESEFQISDCNITCFNNLNIFPFSDNSVLQIERAICGLLPFQRGAD